MRAAAPKKYVFLLLACLMILLLQSACTSPSSALSASSEDEASEPDRSGYLVAVEDEPETVDFQCTTIHYTIATNVFNRLVEMKSDPGGNVVVTPSLAESWEVTGDGRIYTFHLREGVTFSNGSPLTSGDVLFTFERLLTYPDSVNGDIARVIAGADRLESGKTDTLSGFHIIDDLTFTITLDQPYEAFLACLSMPGASIMDETTAREAGERFGKEPEWTIGTGPFIFREWQPGKGMLLEANPDCFEGAPNCDGLDLRFVTQPEEIRRMFEDEELDIISLDDVGNASEFFIHGDIYQSRLHKVQRIALSYIALNEAFRPLNDVRVRKALQLALNRTILLQAVYSGFGKVENGLFPEGLYGYDPELQEIPYDVKEAKRLLAEAGYPDGFDLDLSINSTSSQAEMTLIRLAVSMWEKIGVHAHTDVLEQNEFIRLRRNGKLHCYVATWTADFDDPDNFIYPFFGTAQNSSFRSLGYDDVEIMRRVRLARTITDPDERIREYRELEKKIVQEDAAWIPLFSKLYLYVTSERLEGFRSSWSGSIKNEYRSMSVNAAQ